MNQRLASRRDLLKSTAAATIAAAAGALAQGCAQTSARSGAAPQTAYLTGQVKSQLRIGAVGVGRRGAENIKSVVKLNNARIVALCDVDSQYLDAAAKDLPDARRFADFRDMVEMDGLDAVMVSTADHTHAVASAAAIRRGLHVYCEKPLTRTVYESRRLTELARQYNLVTQLGTQNHAQDNYRRVIELIRAGAIGAVRHVHVFCEKSYAGTQPATAPTGIPPTLNYDLWLGPVAYRPYDPSFHPRYWRRWWAFGNGTLGDMGCHYMDIPFWALGLKAPTRISAQSQPTHPEGCPAWTIVHYEFPALTTTTAMAARPAVKLSWYDCGKLPEDHAKWGLDPKTKDGIVFVGDEGVLFTDYTRHRLLPGGKFKDYKPPAPSIPSSIGHHAEWVNACLRNDPKLALDNFDYAGPLAETVLLGNVAVRAAKPLEWDAAGLRIPNAPAAERFLRSEYRRGWTL